MQALVYTEGAYNPQLYATPIPGGIAGCITAGVQLTTEPDT